MFQPFFLWMAWRYVYTQSRNRFASFIALVSILGIALGVMTLITVLSVMNGFDERMRKQFFSVVPSATIWKQGWTHHLELKNQIIKKMPDVSSSSVFVMGKGMVMYQRAVEGVQVFGIEPGQQQELAFFSTEAGSFSSLTVNSYHVVVGAALAQNFGLHIGDLITLLTPQVNATLFGAVPRFRQLKISGIFKTPPGLGWDAVMIYMNIEDAVRLYGPMVESGIHIYLHHPDHAVWFAHSVAQKLPASYRITNWTESFGEFFQSVAMEKTMMFLILLLIVATAAFNLVSSLMMTVKEKQKDIAILRTMGASPKTILLIFMTQGILIGFLGIALGAFFGIELSLHATTVFDWIQNTTGHHFLSESVYGTNHLPSELQMQDVWQVIGCAAFFSVLATLYPAWRASRTQPALVLRHE